MERDCIFSGSRQGTASEILDKLFLNRKGIYEKLLADPTNVERGTVKELAEKFDVDVMTMVGFLDGINDSLKYRIQSKKWKKIL